MTKLILSFLLLSTICSYSQKTTQDTVINAQIDTSTEKYFYSNVIEVNAKKDAIYDKLWMEFLQGKIGEALIKKDRYTHVRLMPEGIANGNKDKMTFYVILTHEEFKSKNKFSLDPAKSDNPLFAFWHKEDDLRDGEFVSYLTVLIKDNKLKYKFEDIKYFPPLPEIGKGNSFMIVYGYIKMSQTTYEKAGYDIEYTDLNNKFAEQKEENKKFKPNKIQKDVAEKWSKIRPVGIKAYEVFSQILEDYIKAAFNEHDF